MQQDAFSPNQVTGEVNYQAAIGVLFNPDNVTLQGIYSDQLSAYRAKRVWADILEANFLLEREHDFSLTVVSCIPESRFLLTCEFSTACGRYAFWRLTNSQSPESQYLIETAHIPSALSDADAMISAPDLMQADHHSTLFEETRPKAYLTWLKNRINRLKNVF